MRTLTIELFSFSELNKEAQAKVLDASRYCLVDDINWYGDTVDDFKEILSLMGFTDIEVLFSGFYSQGDGACFSASYAYKKGAVKAVAAHAPTSSYIAIVDAIAKIQRKYFYGVTCDISLKPSLYCHANTMSFEWDNTVRADVSCDGFYSAIDDSDSEVLANLFKDLASELYASLQREYEYLTSDEVIKDWLLSNDYDFDIDGGRV